MGRFFISMGHIRATLHQHSLSPSPLWQIVETPSTPPFCKSATTSSPSRCIADPLLSVAVIRMSPIANIAPHVAERPNHSSVATGRISRDRKAARARLKKLFHDFQDVLKLGRVNRTELFT